jgi:hypothetical protein
MAARRKLFLTHAGELAHRLVSAIARDAMAMDFVRGYARRHDRQKIVISYHRLREIESTIAREALLLIAADVRRMLPRAFGSSRNARPAELAICDAFYAEFLAALGRAIEWPIAEAEAEAEAFRRDLEIYANWRERPVTQKKTRKPPSSGSPFPDRCAILLDSGMMDQARRAASQFQSELLRLGTRIFCQLGAPLPQRRQPAKSKSRNGARLQPRAPQGADRRANASRKAGKEKIPRRPRR